MLLLLVNTFVYITIEERRLFNNLCRQQDAQLLQRKRHAPGWKHGGSLGLDLRLRVRVRINRSDPNSDPDLTFTRTRTGDPASDLDLELELDLDPEPYLAMHTV